MADRTINIAGSFKQPVDITNSLQNGYGCVANNHSHAEGFETSATGEYSYAGGYHADAHHHYSYVWSGKNDNNGRFESNGDGTYSIYVKEGSDNVLDKVYINADTLKNRIKTTFGPDFSNASFRKSANTWTGTNTFNANVTFANTSTAAFLGNANFSKDASFGGKTTAITVTDTVKDNRVATLKYVGDLFQSSLNGLSSNYVKRGGSTSAIGSSTKPVYINADGNAVAITNNVVTRGNNTTEGSTTRFVYMNGGSITPSTGTVGNDGKTLVYLNNGTLTASTANVGTTNEGKTITYLKSGKITQSTATVGSSLVLVYLNNGVLTQSPSDVTIGGEYTPIYIKGGSITVCKRVIPTGGGGGGGVTSVTVTGASISSGNNFLKTLTSSTDGNGRVTIAATTTRPTIANIDGLETKLTDFTNSLSSLNSSCTDFKSYCTGFSSSCSKLVSSLANYNLKIGVSVTGTGNVVSSAAFTGGTAIALQKNVTAFTKTASTGSGGALTNVTYSGDTITFTKGNPTPVISITNSTASGTSTEAVASLSYSNGVLTAHKTSVSSGGGGIKLTTEDWPVPQMTITVKASCHTERIRIKKDGWTPLGIVGYNVVYGNHRRIAVMGAYLEGDYAKIKVGNVSDNTTIITDGGTVRVLYSK